MFLCFDGGCAFCERNSSNLNEHEIEPSILVESMRSAGRINHRMDKMKHPAAVIILMGLLGLMAYTNPGMEDYNNFIRQTIIQESQRHRDDSLGRAFGTLFGGLAGGLLASQTVRTDYVFFSLYEAELGKERLKALGVFNNFLLIEKPHLK